MTYTPSLDSPLPLPEYLHLRIKNTAALPLRAAYLHGPYTVYVSVRRQEFHPYRHWESKIEGDELEVPQYEPNLKAGASFYTLLKVPEKLQKHCLEQVTREDVVPLANANAPDHNNPPGPSVGPSVGGNEEIQTPASEPNSVTWVIEVISQTIFSVKATVGFELLLGKDDISIGYGTGFGAATISGPKIPSEGSYQTGSGGGGGENVVTGVLSPSIKLKVQDTLDLWNVPPFPSWNEKSSESSFPEGTESRGREAPDPDELDELEEKRERYEAARRKKRLTKKVHLVIITHGLHSNTGADMLFMKEAIDDEARRIEEVYQEERRHSQKKCESEKVDENATSIEEGQRGDVEDNDREIIIVRGFHENVGQTERGIKYLGKRLAKYILSLANPVQPNPHPLQKPTPRTPNKLHKHNYHPHLTPAARVHPPPMCKPPHVPLRPEASSHSPYRVTSISFIGHSLGGLVQTYAIAFIHAHHPNFFKEAKPINFVALASPFLGLSNENPIYVKFALDFGLVGRTGQDLGLTWRAPNMAASALNAIANLGSTKDSTSTAGKADLTKPLLRILPTGPAHEVLKIFRNRTIYANVVNDGIVPLRTSCLLYLDWKGLGKVEKARRENQVVGLVGWGWQQLTTGDSSPRPRLISKASATTTCETGTNESIVEDAQLPTTQNLATETLNSDGFDSETAGGQVSAVPNPLLQNALISDENTNSPFASLMTFLRPQAGRKPSQDKIPKIYRRSQTFSSTTNTPEPPSSPAELSRAASPANAQDLPSIQGTVAQDRSSIFTSYDAYDDPIIAPPKTTILEAAGDVLNPPLPTVEFIVNPESRPKTIWHDRVYHSEDIPLPPVKERPAQGRRTDNGDGDVSGNSNGNGLFRRSTALTDTTDGSSGTGQTPTKQLKVEEKIARAYHKDLSWRKVLVRLEPDAHNNMVVRRMFANAYGWPVIRHLVDTHFGDTLAARTPDDMEGKGVRPTINIDQNLAETVIDEQPEMRQSGLDEELVNGSLNPKKSNSTEDSGCWSDTAFDTAGDVSSDEGGEKGESSGGSTPLRSSGNRLSWTGSLGIKRRLMTLGGSNNNEEEREEAGTPDEQIDSFLYSRTQSGHASTPITAISRIDALAHGSNSLDAPRSCPTSPSRGTNRPFSEAGGKNVVFDDATKVGLGTGGSSAMRELGRLKRDSLGSQRMGSISSSTCTKGEGEEEIEDVGITEKVARLGFRNCR